MPDDRFNVSTISTNGVIHMFWSQNQLREAASIRTLWIPKSIKKIESFAFFACPNLEIVECEEGGAQLEVSMMAFAECPKLRLVDLSPRESVDSLDSSFQNCPNLTDRRFPKQKDGKDNAVLRDLRQKMPIGQMDYESIRRGLESVYDRMASDPIFGFASYAEKYGTACGHFSSIADWKTVSEEELKKVMVGAFIRNVAYLNFGEVEENEFAAADKDTLRTICSKIHDLCGTDAEKDDVAALEKDYVMLFPRRHHAAFFRMVAAIKPDLVVQIPAKDKLTPVYAWLMGTDFESADQLGWYPLSRFVRTKLQSLLPGKSIYQVGVFSWFLAEAFREDRELNDEAKNRKEKVLDALRQEHLLA